MAPKRKDEYAMVDKARNERQKLTLLVEHGRMLGDHSKELIEDNCDVAEKTRKLIAKSTDSINKLKSA